MRVLAVVPGPEHHGAVRHAEQVVQLLRQRRIQTGLSRTLRTGRADTSTAADTANTATTAGDPGELTWVPFTDALFGPDIASAADAFARWAEQVSGPLVVTLHDVPGSDPDLARDARRVAGYRQVLDHADAIAVCSTHEAERVRTVLDRAASTVPLPIEPLAPAGPRPAWAHRRTLGVLGFVYPGKGHDLALRAARGTGAGVVALGAPSPSSDPGDLAALREQAAQLGVELLVTGPLTEPDLHAAARAVTVPFAAYATRGASASLHTWLACGRRAVTTTGPYAEELAARWPGTVEVTQDPSAAVRTALSDVCLTWLTGPPPRPDVGAAYAELFASVQR